MLNILKHSNKLKSYKRIIDCDQEFNTVVAANNREFNKQIYCRYNSDTIGKKLEMHAG